MKPERAHVLLSFAAVTVLITATHASDGKDVVQELDTLWKARATAAELSGVLERGTARMAAEPSNYDIAWRLARAIRWLALKATDPAEKKRLATEGMRWAQRAIDLQPQRVEGHFYYMMSVGEYGSTLSIARALYEGVGRKFERSGMKAYELDRNFEQGEVLTALGRFYFLLPWPKRDLVKSRRFLEEGAHSHPQILMNFVYLAELEYEAGDLDRARAALERVLVSPSPVPRDESQVEARVLARDHFAQWFPEGMP